MTSRRLRLAAALVAATLLPSVFVAPADAAPADGAAHRGPSPGGSDLRDSYLGPPESLRVR